MTFPCTRHRLPFLGNSSPVCRRCWRRPLPMPSPRRLIAVLLDTRLSPDMYPLARQVREATNHAARACGGTAGVELPSFANTEGSIPELKQRIASTIDFIKGLKPA